MGNYRIDGTHASQGAPVPSNYIANPHALYVCETQVWDEGQEYGRSMAITVLQQFIGVETPLFDELQKQVEQHCMHLKCGLYLREADIPHM